MNTSAPTLNHLDTPRGIFATLLQPSEDNPQLRTTVGPFFVGLGLASLFGLALGMREGGKALWLHALYVPAGVAAVFLVGIPAYFVGMALIDAPIHPRSLVSSAVSATVATGATLAGLAPVTALYLVTGVSAVTSSEIATFALMLSGALGLRTLLRATRQRLQTVDGGKQILGFFINCLFVIFATLFAARIWFSSLPILGGF